MKKRISYLTYLLTAFLLVSNMAYATTINPTAKPIVRTSSDGTTLTFLCVTSAKDEATGVKVEDSYTEAPSWCSKTVTKVIFDSSFSKYKPTSTANWFNGCYELKSIEGISNLILDNVTDLSKMFYNCCSLESVNINSATGSLTNMSQLFYQCFSLNSVVLNLNTANVTDMSELFYDCFNLRSLDLSCFNTANVVNMKGMFRDCKNLKSLIIDNFNTAKVVNMSRMFANCYSISSFNLRNFNTEKVTDMSYMFGDDGSRLVRKPAPLWQQYRNNVMNASTVPTSNSVGSIDITTFNTSNVTDMTGMFWGCENLKSLELRNFKTAKVTNMSSMFRECTHLTTLNIGTFKTNNVTSFANMFSGCKGLTGIDVSGFCTENATNFNGMFDNCSNLKELYLGGFSTSKANDLEKMFNGCSALTTIYILNLWNTDNVANSTDMFTGCSNLVGGNGTRFNAEKTDKSYARIDVTGKPGYMTNLIPNISSGKQAYTILDNNIMTFYYDNKANTRSGLKYPVKPNSSASNLPSWILDYRHQSVKTIIIDNTFADYRPTSTAYWFYQFGNLTNIQGIDNLNTSNVTNMAEMFRYCYVLPSLDLSTFDTSNVTDMSCMFCYCWALTDINISNFNTSKVTSMAHLFHQCPISSVDVSSFDTQNVTNMSIMFAECNNLKTLNLKNFNTAKVTNMSWMFINNPSLTTIEVSDKWSTSSVKQSEAMFYGDAKLVGSMGTKYDAIHFDHEYAQIDGGLCDQGYLSGEYMNNNLIQPYAVLRDSVLTFYYDHNRNCRDGIIYIVDDDYYHNKHFSDMKIPEWCSYGFHTATFDRSFANYKPTTLSCWFYSCGKLRNIEGINNLVTSKVKDMSCMFYFCQQLKNIDLSFFATGCVTNMKEMFYYCKHLTDLNLNSFNTSNVTNMSAMFWMCSTLTKLDLSNFNTAKVIEMDAMFKDCHNIKEINISSFNTSKVTKMNTMFDNCYKLKELDLSKFDTSNVKEMKEMFSSCKSLEKLDISNFDISNVTNISNMFSVCSSLTTLDLSSFDTTNIEEISDLFFWCESLKTIYVSELWNLTKYKYAQEDGGHFFYQCVNLEGGMGTKFDADNHTGPLYARIDKGDSAPGYFTYKEAPVKKGDANCDGKVDVIDISSMANLITQGKYYDWADMNNDEEINAADLVILINNINSAQ